MEITYLGEYAVRVKGKDKTLIIDPFDSASANKTQGGWKKQTADIVISSSADPLHHNIDGVTGNGTDLFVIEGPGEYEVGGVRVYGFSSGPDTTNYLLEVDGFTLLHLGGIKKSINESQTEAMGTINVLFVPGGDAGEIEKATELIAQLEPEIIVPIHCNEDDEGFEKFLKATGKMQVQKEEKLKLASPSDLPEDITVFILKRG